jgi:hypothetical protein
MAATKGNKRGRPQLPSEQRTARRVVARLYPADDALLQQLVKLLGVSEGEVIRRALHALGQKKSDRK